MRVRIGTIEFTDRERRTIRRAMRARGGKATRREVREWLIELVRAALDKRVLVQRALPLDDENGGAP